MREMPYEEFEKEELILRDYLAVDRTILTNENTFLAYIRTFVTLLAAGVTVLHFFDTFFVDLLGWISVAGSIITLLIGIYRYSYVRKDIGRIIKNDNKK